MFNPLNSSNTPPPFTLSQKEIPLENYSTESTSFSAHKGHSTSLATIWLPMPMVAHLLPQPLQVIVCSPITFHLDALQPIQKQKKGDVAGDITTPEGFNISLINVSYRRTINYGRDGRQNADAGEGHYDQPSHHNRRGHYGQ